MGKAESYIKSLKIITVVCIVFYAVLTVFGFAVMASLVPPEAVVETMGVQGMVQGVDASLFSIITGALIVVSSAFQLIAAIAMYRGAKNPSKIKLGLVLYGIIAVCAAINFGMSFSADADSAMLSFTPLFVAICVLGDGFMVYRSTK